MAIISYKKIEENNKALKQKYSDKLLVNQDLTRRLVSFQANKKIPGYRWYKFKEGYSSALVDYVLNKLQIKKGRLIDPFAGSGTSLFASAEKGLDATGIELLPIATEIIEVRKILLNGNKKFYEEKIRWWAKNKPWLTEKETVKVNSLNITNGAYPGGSKVLIGKYLATTEKQADKKLARILRFALLCILEEISYTRKDGQYLRWDYRSKKRNGNSTFNKGIIRRFDDAIVQKLQEISNDLEPPVTLFTFERQSPGQIKILSGSCLSLLPTFDKESYDALMTSPPYCNRYDYTRTYALELALLGINESGIKQLRQAMLSCTVENRDKDNLGEILPKKTIKTANKSFISQKELQEIILFLEEKKRKKELNNPGIVRMVRNYFYEMALVIFEAARILKKGAPFIMVNDNVRYAGAIIPVDLILSSFAEDAGYSVEKIWVLPNGKGNSSQQMGKHGREELRKCVYVWRRL